MNLRELDHPGIVKYYETYDDIKFLYVVTEYIHGLTINHKVAQDKSEQKVCDYI